MMLNHFCRQAPCLAGCLIMAILWSNCNSSALERTQEATVEYVLSGGDSLFVRSIGDGPPLIIVHGGPGMDHTYFLPHMDVLSENFTLIYYDQRASGRSSIMVSDSSMTMSHFTQDLDRIRRHFEWPQIHVLGHSWGGLLAMQYAISHSQHMSSLILVGSLPASTDFRAEQQAIINERQSSEDSLERIEILSSEAFQNGEIEAYERLFRLIFKRDFYDKSNVEQLHLDFQPGFLAGNQKLQMLGPSLISYDIHDQLEQLKLPVLILYGSYDPLAVKGADHLHDAFPNSELVMLDSAGHFPFVERKFEFFHVVREFMQKSL